MFELWLSAVISNQHFFSAAVTQFKPGVDRVYQDDYASLLVARNIGLDTCVSCYNGSFNHIAAAESALKTRFARDRDISCFSGGAACSFPRS